ncbi:G2 and S phase-expressed protein 1 [Ochotona princeps]|uniref:G2 and S phase-expressed protein 1 n=1 Tax=Ochotona princeps TaxID=9978 RepID=UPI0027149123|nr:G2 and S phase-expressed protein 1 [Ochotona princeps]
MLPRDFRKDFRGGCSGPADPFQTDQSAPAQSDGAFKSLAGFGGVGRGGPLSSRPAGTRDGPAFPRSPTCPGHLPHSGRFLLAALAMDRAAGGHAQTDEAEKEGVVLLADEQFDFDLSLSPSSANEDEVFFGPVGHKERCIAASLELSSPAPGPAPGSPLEWSPLAGEKFVEVYKEARLLALQIEGSRRPRAAPAAQPHEPASHTVERFVQESQLKLSLFDKEREEQKSPKSLKRETYFLPNSPLGPVLPGLQPSVVPSSAAQAGPVRAQGPLLSSHPGAARPANPTVTQKRVPSKLQLPRASVAGRGKGLHVTSEKLKKEMPSRLPSTETLKGKELRGGALADAASAPLDTASVPAAGSHLAPGKRSLPVPPKLGLRKSLLRPPSCSLARKSSSSGGVSREVAGVCPSPTAGRAKLASTPANGSLPLPNTGRLGRTGPTVPPQPLPAAESNRAKSTLEQPTVPPAAAPTQPQTPRTRDPGLLPASSRLSEVGSVGRQDSHRRSSTKTMPTPTDPFKVPKFSVVHSPSVRRSQEVHPDLPRGWQGPSIRAVMCCLQGGSPGGTTPKPSRVQRSQSCASARRVVIHSTPTRCVSGLASPGLASSVQPPRSARHLSALPTPTGRRLSSFVRDTPRTAPRALASPLPGPAWRLSSEPRQKCAVRMEPTQGNSGAESEPAAWSPEGSSCAPAVPQALSFSPERSELTSPKCTGPEAALEEAKPSVDAAPGEALLVDIGLAQLSLTAVAGSRSPTDLPLIDFCSSPEVNVVQGSESRPLTDLMTNTPDLSRSVAPKPAPVVGQLIDLSSPLIQLSPAADKENVDSPLLKF